MIATQKQPSPLGNNGDFESHIRMKQEDCLVSSIISDYMLMWSRLY